jgi:hypothetical protein
VHWIDVRLEVQNVGLQQFLELRASSSERHGLFDRISAREEEIRINMLLKKKRGEIIYAKSEKLVFGEHACNTVSRSLCNKTITTGLSFGGLRNKKLSNPLLR